MTDIIEKLPLTSMDMTDFQREKLKALFPEVFTEGNKIDFEKLRLTLGEDVDTGKERFGLNWAGKSDCFQTIKQSSVATLVPARDESVDFDTTENLYIEGDNLEVLKLLQKSYLGKVKMIYIDPPYNTGNDFIYPDNYAENLSTYLEYTGQVDGDGRAISTNKDTDGRFHSKWLNMMYPRLFLAKNLLTEDGVIFISIDDYEIHNLRGLCNEIFGEENFRNVFTLKRYDKNINRQFMDDGLMSFNTGFEYVLCYSKSSNFKFAPIFRDASEDRQENGYWKGFWNDADRPTMRYEILGFTPEMGQWKWSFDKAMEAVENYKKYENEFSSTMSLEDYWKKTGESLKFIKRNLNGKGKNMGVEHWIPPSDGVLRNTSWQDIFASKTTEEIKGLFDFPKNIDAIKLMVSSLLEPNGFILDFFSGSSTTAHAVLDLNKEDGGNRKFIMVQLPEPCDKDSEAFKAGYKNIAEIGKERIRRVINKIKTEQTANEAKADLVDKLNESNAPLDLGFKVFKLQKSNFKVWDANIEKTPEAIQFALDEFVDHINPQAEQEAILFELLLKSGFELTTPIEKLTLSDKTVFSIADGALLICLEKELTHDVISEMAKRSPSRVICLDEGFQNNDQLKTNAVLMMKNHGVEVFRTV